MKRYSLTALFLTGALILLIEGLTGQLLIRNSTFDIQLHDTYFMIPGFYVAALPVCFMGLLAGIYYLFPRLFKRPLNRNAGMIHFLLTLFCLAVIFWPVTYTGIAGTPRRYYDYASHEAFNPFASINILIAWITVLCFAAQLIFLFNLVISAVAGKKIERG